MTFLNIFMRISSPRHALLGVPYYVSRVVVDTIKIAEPFPWLFAIWKENGLGIGHMANPSTNELPYHNSM